MKISGYKTTLIVIGMVALLWGCGAGSRLMMPTPNVYIDDTLEVYHNLPEELKSTQVRLFYVTDRNPEETDNGKLHYGYGRSSSLAFGTTVVELGQDISWEELLEASRTRQRVKPVKLSLRDVTELIRYPDTPLPIALINGKLVEEPVLLAKREAAALELKHLLAQQLARTPRKEVFIYVHGYQNDFDKAAFAMAEVWHFLGRIGVPLVYTWPAGYPGLFGYTYDRESSEFTTYHLRETLGAIASLPEVEKINIIAHSRGADIAIAALRELTIGARRAGIDPIRQFKIHNFVLAAPDIDVEVAGQRVSGDKILFSVKRFTVYTSPEDGAIGAANRLFRSPRGRVGAIEPDHTTQSTRKALAYNNSNFAIINFPGFYDRKGHEGDRFGHGYFRNAPAASSDLVLMLRDDLDPGAPGRPLEHIDLVFWRIPSRYPDMNQAQ